MPAKKQETKSILQSKTVYGVIIMIATTVLSNYGISEAEVAEIVNLVGNTVGAVLAVYGRAVATARITL